MSASASHASRARVPLAGGAGVTLLSEVAAALLPLFSTRDACALRLVCREFKAAASAHPWADARTVIKGSIAAWRACFPRALCANVAQGSPLPRDPVRRTPVVDADFVHLRGLRELNMAYCTSVTDAAFAHLHGIHTLDMSRCCQAGITDAAFAHLRGVHELRMYRCNQAGITDAAFAHLRGIHTLFMAGCNQAGITDAAFAHLRGIHTLHMFSCDQATITDAAFAHLRGIRILDVSFCVQPSITGAGFVHLAGIEALSMEDCTKKCIAAARAWGLPALANDALGAELAMSMLCAKK